MKNTFKRIISLLTVFCIVLPLIQITPVFAETIYLDETGYIYGDMQSLYFTPDESGFYQFRLDADDYEAMDVGFASIRDMNFGNSPLLFEVSHHNEMTMYGAMPRSYFCYLEEGIEYVFEVSGAMGMYGGYTSTRYCLTRAAVNDLGEYSIGESINVDLVFAELEVLHYTAAETRQVMFSTDMGYLCIYDINNMMATGTGYESQVTLDVVEGDEYYIVLSCYDPEMWGSATLTSMYMEQTDNSPVETSDIAEMQSSHPYQINLDKSWTYNAPEGTIYNEITFDSSSELKLWDYLYVYDADGNRVQDYDYWDTFSNKTLTIPGDKFTIKLVTDSSDVGYGFALSSINSYTTVPAPTASLESGTIRPSNVTLKGSSIATLYYKLSTADDEGTFAQYTSAISITENSTLSVYAKVGDYVSETVAYVYTIDDSPIPKPEFSVKSSSATSISLYITATEGDVYYKKMSESSSYSKLSAGSSVYVSKNDVIAAYAMSGTLKSEVVYYACNITDNSTYELAAPVITETPIMGGKTITVSIPDEFEYKNEEVMSNYGYSHPSEMCGQTEGETHDFGPWSRKYESTYTHVSGGDADSRIVSGYFYEADDFPKTYTVYKNTAISAQSYYDYQFESGEWMSTEMPMGPGYYEYYHEMTYDESDYYSYTSPRSYLYIEVPKAQQPEFTVNAGKLQISAGEGQIIYYKLNNGAESEYTESIAVKNGDVISSYAIGMGVAKSDASEYSVMLDGVDIKGAAVLGGYEIEVISADASDDVYYSTDGESYDLYTEKLFVAEDTTVYAYSVRDGEKSDTKSLSVTVPKASVPTASHQNGTYAQGTTITFTSANSDEQVYYTLGESTVKYTNAISLKDNMKISVYAIGLGIAKSEVVDFEYAILKAEAPTFTETDILGGKLISIFTTTEGASIRYKIDNGEYTLYTQPFEVYDIAKISAYTVLEGAADSAVIEHNVTMTQTADPVPNYASGEVFGGTKIELTSYNDGAETVIYYTLDNSEPTKESIVYSDGITITAPTTVKAVAYAKGRAVSEIVTLNYTLRTAKKPTITEQNVKGGKKIYIASQTEDSVVYYTIDGTDPKISSTAVLYEAPFIVGESGTKICAYAKASGYLDSDTAEHTVEIGQLPMPVLSVTEENVYINTSLEISADSFADIYYTLDGTEPTKESQRYTSPIIITDDVTVKAIAVSDGWQSSAVAEKSYKIYGTEKPYIVKTKNGDKMKIELKSETPDATIYYTLDGTEPTKTSSIYKQGILLSADITVKAFAESENRKASDVYTETVLVRHTADPVVNLSSGEISRTDKITITANENAKIYYTLDGSEPTEESTLYAAPFSINAKTTLKVFAVEEGCLDSNILTYEYTIKRAKNPEILLNEDILGGKSIKIESAESDAKIYYTTDGSTPSTASALYTKPFDIYKTTVIRALAVVEGCDNSEIAYREMAVPVADIVSSNVVRYFLKDDFVNTSISSQRVYYTLDGTNPTLASDIYEPGTIKVDKSITMKAFAIGYGYAQSKSVTLYFNIETAYSQIYVKYGEDEAEITLTPVPENAVMYYTLDESDPSLESNPNRVLYTDTFKITQDATLNIYTSADRYKSSTNSKKIYINMAKQPNFEVQGESYSGNGNIYVKRGSYVKLYSPDGIKIRYTTDGSEPNAENGIEYTSPICIDDKMTIRAYCYGENFENSFVRTFYFKIYNVFGSIVTENVPGGKNIVIYPKAGADMAYSERIGSVFKDFTVYYTTDGTEPTPETAKIYEKVDSNGNYVVEPKAEWFTDKDVTVKVLVVADNCNSADVVSENITVKKLNKPSYVPAETVIYKNSYISLESAEPGSYICYTTDGTEPTLESAVYEKPFTIEDDTTIKMIAVKPGMATSDVVVANYTLKRAETPSYTTKMTASGMLVTIDCETENAKIYYTVNGDIPTDKSTLYTAPFKLKKNTVLKIVAICDNMKESYVVSELIDVPTAQMSIVGISDVTAEDGYAEATLYLQNNPGIAAYAISVEYDNSVLTPVSAENLMGGIFTTNIGKGTGSGIDKAISMVWLGTTSVYEDLAAAKIKFKVNDAASAQTSPLYIKENGVINHLYEMVDVAYMDGSVEITGDAGIPSLSLNSVGSKQTLYTDTKLSMTTAVKDNKLTVTVVVDENSGIGAYNISLLYDNTVLTPATVENGKLFTSDIMSNVTQPGANVSEMSEITVLSCNDKNSTDNGVLFTVVFDIKKSAGGQMIGFSDVMLLDTEGNEIVGIYEDATVKKEVKTITKVEAGKIKVTPYNVPENSSILVAGYKNKCLTFCYEFQNDNNEISLNMPEVSTDTIRVYVWENLSNIRPLSTIIDEVSVN